MAILFRKVQRPNPRDGDAAHRWYAVVRTVNMATEKEVAELISDEISLNKYEAMTAMNQLLKVVGRLLLSGRSVQLGDWGYFRLSAESDASDTKDSCSARNITGLNVRFLPGKELKHMLTAAEFVETATLI